MMSTVSEKLLQVAQNNPKVYHSGQLNIVKNAECLKGSKSGSAMLLDDVSPVTHEMGVKVRGKNLFDYDGVDFKNEDTILQPITFVKENNSLQFTNTHTQYPKYAYTENISEFGLMPNTTYTSKVIVTLLDNGTSNIEQAGSMSLSLLLQTNNNFDSSGKGKVYIVNGYNPKYYTNPGTYEFITTFTTPSDMTDFKYIVTRLPNNTTTIFKDLQIEEGTTATDYTPYVPDLTAVKVKRCGKNFIDIDSIANDIVKKNPTSCEITDFDGKRCLKIGATSTIRYTIQTLIPLYGLQLKAYSTGYSVSFMGYTKKDTETSVYYISVSAENEWVNITRYYSGVSQYYTGIQFYKEDASKPIYIDLDSVMLEASHTATEYEPYKGAEYIPSADGTVNSVTSLYPNTTLTTDTDGVLIDCEYYKDVDKTFNELTTSVALSGGDS